MSTTDHIRAAQSAMDQTQSDAHRPCGGASDNGSATSGTPERLRAIHDLVRSGGYAIPATVIADCMIERMIVDKRGLGS